MIIHKSIIITVIDATNCNSDCQHMTDEHRCQLTGEQLCPSHKDGQYYRSKGCQDVFGLPDDVCPHCGNSHYDVIGGMMGSDDILHINCKCQVCLKHFKR